MLKSCLPMHQLIDVIIIYLQTLKVENVPFLLDQKDPNILSRKYICVASELTQVGVCYLHCNPILCVYV